MVRVLTPDQEKSIYSRHDKLGLKVIPKATIVGTGGTGTQVAILLAMSGTKEFLLMDEDYLELSNLNRLPYTVEDLDLPKSELLKQYIEAIRPSTRVITAPRATELTMKLLQGTIFDCTDRHGTQIELCKYAKAKKLPYIRVGYDGMSMTVTDSVPEWCVDRAPDEGGYTITPSWIVPAMMAACLAVTKAMYAPGIEVSHSVNEVFSPKHMDTDKLLWEVSITQLTLAKFGLTMKERKSSSICKRCGKAMTIHDKFLFCKDQG